MKYLIILVFSLLNYAHAQSQNNRTVGLMVLIEDSLTHHFVGGSEADKFVSRYPTIADFQTYAMDTTLLLLEQNFHKWDFCTMGSDFFWVYEENREKLRATDFRSFREEWFNTITEEHEIDAILVIRNSPDFADAIHWSNTIITGYGIYNGSRRANNSIYIQLEFLFFATGRPLTYIQGPIFQQDRNFPRIDKKDDVFTEYDLLVLEEPLKQLIVNQIEAAINDANLLRRLR